MRLEQHYRRLSYALTHPAKYRELQALRLPGSGSAYHDFKKANCIFVHIPKCAGNSIEDALFARSLRGHHSIWYYQMLFTPGEFQRAFKFTVVRNPWDRLVSAFLFLRAGGKTDFDRSWAEHNIARFGDFDSFVRGWVTSANIDTWIHFRPQKTFVCLANRLLVDFVAKFETLDEDFALIRERLSIHRPLEKLNPTASRRDYRSYYTDHTREIAGAVYREDIALFRYTFDGHVDT